MKWTWKNLGPKQGQTSFGVCMMVSGGGSTGVGVVSLIGSALWQSLLLVVVVLAFYDDLGSCLDGEGAWQSLVGRWRCAVSPEQVENTSEKP